MLTALALAALIAQPPSIADVTVLDEIEVTGRRLDYRLGVEVAGDLDESTVVVSSPVSIRCGGDTWRYSLIYSPRQCWYRGLPTTAVELEARAVGAFTVTWSGCEPENDPRRCRAVFGAAPLRVTATFKKG